MNRITKAYITAGVICSNVIALIITMPFVMNSVNKIVNTKAVLLSSFSLSLLGALAAITALTFTFRTICDGHDKENSSYAAEKFFHGLLLMVQVFLIAAMTTLLDDLQYRICKSVIMVSLKILCSVLSAFACWFIYWGFEAINSLLWERYIIRINKIQTK